MEKVLPDLYKDREAMLDEIAELQKRVARLRMYGPRSREDLELYFFIISGQVRVPDGAIWDWEKWYTTAEKKAGFAKGMFSIRKVIEGVNADKDFNKRYDVMDVKNVNAASNLYRGQGFFGPADTGGDSSRPSANQRNLGKYNPPSFSNNP